MTIDFENLRCSFIDGKWLAISETEGESFVKINPAQTNDQIGPVQTSMTHVDTAVECGRRAAALWQKTPLEKRLGFLKILADLISKHSELLAQSITREIGKPMWESRSEIKNVLNKFLITQNEALKWVENFSVAGPNVAIKATCQFKPHGVMVVLGPFNFPLHLVMGHLIPALACGNCVILKPSDQAPLTSMLLAELFSQAGFPAGIFGMVQGGAAIGEKLCRHPDIDGILFTGSYAVGRKIKEWTLDQPGKILALEMGGKNASVIWHDASVPEATAAVLQSATITCGQRCTATSHLIVHEKVFDQVVSELEKMASQLNIGDPTQEATFMGPLISEASRQRFFQANAKAVSLGAHAMSIQNLSNIPQTGFFVTPAVLRFDALPKRELFLSGYFDQEIFAPALALYPVTAVKDAVDFINQSQFGLALSIFSKGPEIFETFLESCRVGVCNWNRPTTGASSALPFGGQKASGNHFPTALFAAKYCTYPVATLREEDPSTVEKLNGFRCLESK